MLNLSRRGQGTVEYVLMVSLAAVLVIAVMLFFGPTIKEFYTHVMGEDAMPRYQEEVEQGLEGE